MIFWRYWAVWFIVQWQSTGLREVIRSLSELLPTDMSLNNSFFAARRAQETFDHLQLRTLPFMNPFLSSVPNLVFITLYSFFPQRAHLLSFRCHGLWFCPKPRDQPGLNQPGGIRGQCPLPRHWPTPERGGRFYNRATGFPRCPLSPSSFWPGSHIPARD